MSYNTELQNNNQELREILEDVNELPSYPEVPTKISELENDSGFITKVVDDLVNYYSKSSTYNRDEVNTLVSSIPKFSISVVSSLPTSNISTTTIYLLSGGSGSNLYTEYIYTGGKWELLGAQTVDLTGYAKESWVITQLGSYLKQSELDAAINTALAQAKASGEFNGIDGKTPVKGVDYYTEADKSEFSEYIAEELAKRGQLAPEYANSIEECTDQSKMYVLPDGFIYAYMLTEKEVETGGGYTNLIDGTNGYIKDGYRYSASSAAFKPLTGGASIIVPVPTSGSITIRVRGMKYNSGYPTVYGGTTNTAFKNCFNDTVVTKDTYDTNGDWYFTFANTKSISYIVTTGILTGAVADVIATVNEEIVEGGTEIITEYDWANTGLAFVPADYEDRIVDLESEISQNSADIENLKKGVTTSTPIKDWDSPIYDANIPVFELSAEKAAMTNAPCTPSDIYAKYDALMVKHPRYIKKTDLGLCSDGVNHVYRYDFREPEPLHESNKEWSETKAKAIIVTGIHFEWAGIYAMYNALEEIADNPELRNFRRNTHLIVVPCCNPYATIASNYQSGLSTPNSYGVRNANGVEIHRNFEVDWVLTEAGTTHYGGAAPLSEVETQYIDNIMKNNTDAALFLSCHNCGVDTFWGTGFIWASTATKHMCNMGYRVIDKLSDAWMDKYGDTLSAGIAEYKTSALADGETRLGWTGLSTSPGTEAKQATKYGIQGTNVEICDPFQIHGTKANPEPSMSSFTMSRGAEVYANFLLTAFGVYDPKDKALYGGNQ